MKIKMNLGGLTAHSDAMSFAAQGGYVFRSRLSYLTYEYEATLYGVTAKSDRLSHAIVLVNDKVRKERAVLEMKILESIT